MKADNPVGENLPGKGSYVLIMELPETREIEVGRLSPVFFLAGWYSYAGSALGGFKSRINRHLRKEKKLHWHIDYLLQYAEVAGLVLVEVEKKLECDIARVLDRRYSVIHGFGSSDCRCPGHLFYSPSGMIDEIEEILITSGVLAGQIQTIIL